MRYLLPIIVFSLLLYTSACKKDHPVKTIDLGYNYFPLEEGKWLIYDVDSIVHDDNNQTIDTFNYQIKEVLTSSYLDNDGWRVYKVERYKRTGTANNWNEWKLDKVWSTKKDNNLAIKTQENIPYVKFVFPPKTGKRWNGYAYYDTTNFSDTVFQFVNVDVAYEINGLSLDSTAEILQFENVNFIEERTKKEVYARNIGLVYFELIDLDLQRNAGVEYAEKLNSYGN